MGQSFSIANSDVPYTKAIKQGGGEQSSLLGFLGLWLGFARDPPPLPTSWEELLEWCEFFTSWKLVSVVDPNSTNNILLCESKEGYGGADMDSVATHLVFSPVVDTNQIDHLARMASLPWIDRAIFYHQNVRIQVGQSCHGDSNDLPSLLNVTVADLGRLYKRGRHIVELKKTLYHTTAQMSESDRGESSDIGLCEICCDAKENTQLPCGHTICRDCETRWVIRKLTCPFCRTRFGSARTIAQNGWDLTQFDPQHLQNDLKMEQEKMNELWNSIQRQSRLSAQETAETNNRTFVPLPLRLLETRDVEGFGLIDERTSSL